MKLKIFNSDLLDKNLKATVHKTGKLGFTIEAARKLLLEKDSIAVIGQNEEDPWDDCLYLAILTGNKNGAFKVSKAGEYFYINTKALFDTLKIDYQKDNVVFDIIPTDEAFEGYRLFKLKRRTKDKKMNEDS